MKKAPIPQNEAERLKAVRRLGILDTKPEARFEKITKLAAKIFHVPIATLTIVDSDREWFKSCHGLSLREGDRAISFCGHALLADDMLVVEDTKLDARFADNPMVVGEPFIRFYAGVPILDLEGNRIGVFCIKARQARTFTDDEREILRGLADWAQNEINLHNLILKSEKVSKSHRVRQQVDR